jgi:hypothetical protein
MKVFMVVDEDGRNVAATLYEGTAVDILFSRAIDAGRVDTTEMTFDQAGDQIIQFDGEEAMGILTDSQMNELDTEGLVLL